MTINQLGSFNSKPKNEIDSWIAYDLEWSVIKNSNKSRISKIDKNTSTTSMPPIFSKEEEYREIVTFAYEDSYGNKGCLDITEFDSTKLFLGTIKEKLLQYQYCIAWGSKAIRRRNVKMGKLEGISGDLVILDSNLEKYGIPSIVKYNKFSGIPYIKRDAFTPNKIFLADIDLLKVFAKPLVRLFFKNKYKSLHLDDVCNVLLGIGKLNGNTGAKLEKMSIEERKTYCIQDAHLVAELIRIRDGYILRIMEIISVHTGLSFEEVCHKGMPSIWKKMIDKSISKKIGIVGYENIPFILRKLYSNNVSHRNYPDSFDEDEYDEDDENEELLEYKENSYDYYIDIIDRKSRNKESDAEDDYSNAAYSISNRKNNEKPVTYNKYKGGLVLDPLRGLHLDVYLFDITSLYPTITINNNISPDTVNCSCCRNDDKARLVFDKDISDDLKHGHIVDNNRSIYWICNRRKGFFSKDMEELTQKRIQYKKEGKELESTAIKTIINSGYGVFGDPNFKYCDLKVAEVITALGRQTLLDMKKIAKEMCFSVIYGDTDSLFVNNIKDIEDVTRFIRKCKENLNVEVAHEKTFRKLILVGKKHYVGIPYGDDKPIIRGMEGIKSNSPEFIQTTFRQMVKDIQEDVSPIPKLKQALADLNKRLVPKERLTISLVLEKDPTDYIHDDKQKKLGTKLKLKKGDTLVYYKCDKQTSIRDQTVKQLIKTIGESDDPNDISYSKYKEMLINTVKDVIEILGYCVEKDMLAKRKLF